MSSNDPLAYAPMLGQLLLERGWMFACAESCTGGLLAAAMTDTPGSSQWFDRGFVTYSNAAKAEQLLVNVDTLERFGAVSEETAMEMAAGVLTAAQPAQLAISTTGIAGPDGGTPGKPVGMVCFGFAQRAPQGIVTRAITKVFEGDRRQIRHAAVAFALDTAIGFIEPR
ncbi:CinA family protein [Pollutimonas bauzanensis]|uniref:Nicotinamide-nucleotide amidase n=1 Tax=Pollutimonas bauzanensis TaxID=658167 RepID=A0A1M5ZK69_9BURK|nr:CinA family protein [Pollutimonas bauzanensis]SHI24626.1 nicotinamide-nucleotide amidase [Pollutimonas bauzanensis]